MTAGERATLTVSVVIPTYQRAEALPEPVERLLADAELHEVVVVVDGSTDATVQWLEARAATDRRLRAVVRPNLGIAAARQAGAEAATGDVLLFLDDDVIPEATLAAGHRDHHARRRSLVVQGYMPNDWASLPRGRRSIGRIYREAYEMTCARYEADPAHVLLGFWAGNFSVRREDALAVGLATPVVGGLRGQEDREFGIRCHAAGMTGVFDRALLAEHRYERDLDAFRADMRRSGHFRRLIHELHPEIVGHDLVERSSDANTADLPGQRLPSILRRWWPRLAAPPWFQRLMRLFTGAHRAGARLGLIGLETNAARAIGSLETQRGVNDY
jgi:glycosyltransferase involved in cell wall biosynthesis